MKWDSFLLFFIGCSTIINAQGIQRFRMEGQYGYIITHSSDLKPLSGNRPTALHLAWQWMGTERNHWEVCNCFHYLGVQFSYLDFGDREVLGEAYTLAGSFEPVLWRHKNLSLSLNSGIGFTWLTRIHHPETNPLNNFFSSNFSFLLYLSPAVEYRFYDNWSARLSANYNHISNGGQKQPNRGMNYPQLGLGINYYLQHTELSDYKPHEKPERLSIWVESGVTTHKINDGDRRKPSVSMVGGLKRSLSGINALGGGFEATQDYSMIRNSGEYGKGWVAPFISHHFALGRFDFSQRMAWYIKPPEKLSPHQFYQRYVLFLNLISDFHIGASLKAHGHVASNLDFRFGWQF